MAEENTISVIIPALNEAKNIEATVDAVIQSVNNYFDDYEVFIFNDGSIDKTGKIADQIASTNRKVKTIHHKKQKCLGGVYKEGLKLANKNYLILVNGKNDITANNLDKIFTLRGKADLIVPYTLNINDRSLSRKAISKLFVMILNIIFKLKLYYYNHYVLHKKDIVDSISIITDSYAFQAEILIKLIKAGHSYKEVGVVDKFEKDIKTKAFYLNNILGVGVFLLKMIGEIYLKGYYKRYEYFRKN